MVSSLTAGRHQRQYLLLEAKEGVDKEDDDLGAGDQGMMFGYAA